MSPRAPALSPERRRQALIDATLPLVRTKGHSVTTREIAAAAGVAEGTIFRVFDSKCELIDAAVEKALSLSAFTAELETLDATLTFEERVSTLIAMCQERFRATFALMAALQIKGPPPVRRDDEERARLNTTIATLLSVEGSESLRIPLPQFAALCRSLAFSACNPHFTDGHDFPPELLASILLDGVRTPTPEPQTEEN